MTSHAPTCTERMKAWLLINENNSQLNHKSRPDFPLWLAKRIKQRWRKTRLLWNPFVLFGSLRSATTIQAFRQAEAPTHTARVLLKEQLWKPNPVAEAHCCCSNVSQMYLLHRQQCPALFCFFVFLINCEEISHSMTASVWCAYLW